jgi:hypothetical protein
MAAAGPPWKAQLLLLLLLLWTVRKRWYAPILTVTQDLAVSIVVVRFGEAVETAEAAH